MERCVLFFDIDGTLLSEITKEVPESTLLALDAAKRAGHMLFVNTGRTVCSLPPRFRMKPFDGYLCGCGTYLVCGEKVLFSHSLPEERGREILEQVRKCGLEGMAEGQEDVYFSERLSRFEPLEATRRYFRARGIGIGCTFEKGDFVYDKLFVYSDERSDLRSFFSFIEQDMEAINRGSGTYEIIQKGYSKATACEFILDRFGFSREQMYVFGDSGNDLAMFQCGGHGVAMGHHDPILEPWAEFVTKRVEDDGIAFAMRHFGLI